MASCKECIHFDRCKGLYKFDRLQKAVSKGCSYFKDRSRFVELPCRVGDKVYFNNVHLRYARVIAIYIDASGGMFDLDITTNIATATGYEHFINKDYTFEDIGRRLFLTREEAEQALKLKERENDA